MAESSFATPGCEPPDRRGSRSRAEARIAVSSRTEGRYDPGRRHSALGYPSPLGREGQTRMEP